MHLLRRRGFDLFVVLFAAADGASVLLSDGTAPRPLVAAVTVLAVLALAGRRRSPLAASLSAFALTIVSFAMSPELTSFQFAGLVLTFVVTGAVNRGRGLLVGAAAGAVVLAGGAFVAPNGGGLPDFLLSCVICEGFLVVAHLLSRRTHQVTLMREDVELSDERARSRTREALAEERARIARELHDVVSHGLSVVIVQAQAARASLEDVPASGSGTVQRNLVAIESTAREGLAEMRRMLGLLQLDPGPGAGVPEPPSPGLGELAALVRRGSDAGLQVVAELPGPDARLPSGLALATYRVVQEALTNVVRHAPGCHVEVCVRVDADTVDIGVVNTAGAETATPRKGGHGLVGMRERVAMYGGRLATGTTREGGFAVNAVLPIDHAELVDQGPGTSTGAGGRP